MGTSCGTMNSSIVRRDSGNGNMGSTENGIEFFKIQIFYTIYKDFQIKQNQFLIQRGFYTKDQRECCNIIFVQAPYDPNLKVEDIGLKNVLTDFDNLIAALYRQII